MATRIVDYNKHARCMLLLNLFGEAFNAQVHSVKGFFEELKERDLGVTVEDLKQDPVIMDNPDFINLVSRAENELYPFEDYAEAQVDVINIRDSVKSHQKKSFGGLFKSKKKDNNDNNDLSELEILAAMEAEEKEEFIEDDIVDQVAQNQFTYDGTTSMVDAINSITPDQTQKVNKDTTGAVDAIVPDQTLKADKDTKLKMDTICNLIKDRVPKDTLITTSYNYAEGDFFTVEIKFPDGKTNVITVDAKCILPDYYSVVINGIGAVPFDDPVSQKLIEIPLYKPTKEETDHVIGKYYLEGLGLYYVYDFSALAGMSELNPDNRKEFSKVLLSVAKEFTVPNTNEVPRFRFEKFNWIDDFVIVSDDKAKTPLAPVGANSTNVANIRVVVKDGNVVSATPIDQ